MPTYVTKDEFEARVGVLEGEVEGEKLVTRHILEQTRRNSDDLATIKSRLSRVEGRLDQVEQKLDGLDRKVENLSREFRGFPAMVGEVVREVLRERDPK
jgi:predicted translin family RNA/ssDNA-binding protein